MIWKLVLILIFSNGEPMELIGADEFKSMAACNSELHRLTEFKSGVPWTATCVPFIQA